MAYDPNVLRRPPARLEEEKRRREDERELLRRQTYAKEPRLASWTDGSRAPWPSW